MGQHPGYYTRQLVKLQKELQSKQSQLRVQQDINDGLRWKEQMLKTAVAAVASGVKAAKPASGQQSSSSSADQSPAESICVKPELCSWQSSVPDSPAEVLLNSSSYCQQDTTDADSSVSSTLDAALESAIFSALDADSSTDIFFLDAETAALNHLLSQLATTELKVQSTLLQLGCTEQPGERLYTSQLLQQLLASGGQQRLQAAAEVAPEDCLLQMAAAVKQISCLLPGYDDGGSCHVSSWSARSQVDCLVDQQVQSAVARGLAGNPCAGLQHLAVNMETMSQQGYPDGWFVRVTASLQLTVEQQAVLTAAWSKITVDRASLLARHEVLTRQLLEMQQQQATKQQEFGLRLQMTSERCVYAMQKQAMQKMQVQLPPRAAATAAGSVQLKTCRAALAGVYTTSSGGNLISTNSTASAARTVHFYSRRSSSGGSGGSSCSASTSPTFHSASSAGGVTCGGAQQQSGCIRASSPAALSAGSTAILSMTCGAHGPNSANAAGAAAFALASHPEVLMCAPRLGQQQLQQQLSSVRCSLALLYNWASLVSYNALSRKQLAVAAVTSYPFAFDPVAVCEAAAACLPTQRPNTAGTRLPELRFA